MSLRGTNFAVLRFLSRHELYKLFSQFRVKYRGTEFITAGFMGTDQPNTVYFEGRSDYFVLECAFKDVEVFEPFIIYLDEDKLRSFMSKLWGEKRKKAERVSVEVRFSRFNRIDLYFDGKYESSIETEKRIPRIVNELFPYRKESLFRTEIERRMLEHVLIEGAGEECLLVKYDTNNHMMSWSGKSQRVIDGSTLYCEFDFSNLVILEPMNGEVSGCSQIDRSHLATMRSLCERVITPSQGFFFHVNEDLTFKTEIESEEVLISFHAYYFLPHLDYEGKDLLNKMGSMAFATEGRYEKEKLVDEHQKVRELIGKKIVLLEERIQIWKGYMEEWEEWTKQKMIDTMGGYGISPALPHQPISHKKDELIEAYKKEILKETKDYEKLLKELKEWTNTLQEEKEAFESMKAMIGKKIKREIDIDYVNRGSEAGIGIWGEKESLEVRKTLETHVGSVLALFGGNGYRKVVEPFYLMEVERVKRMERGHDDAYSLVLNGMIIIYKNFSDDEVWKLKKEHHILPQLKKVSLNLGFWKLGLYT